MPWQLQAAVGLTDRGTQCPNHAFDQQQVAELLDAIGVMSGGTPQSGLPPIANGRASPELCEALHRFQGAQGLAQDSRVDIDGATWQRLVAIARPDERPRLGPVALMLNAVDFSVLELPLSAADLPSFAYTLRGPIATLDAGGVRMELSINGPVKVGWSSAYPVSCVASPDVAALEAALSTGAARAIGGAALDQLCSRLKVESKAAIGSLFAAISLKVGLDGIPVIGGSIGDDQAFTSLEFDPAGRALIYKVTRRLQRIHPVTTGGEVQVLSAGVELQLKVTTEDGDQASAVAALVAAVVVAVVLAPVAEWAAGAIAAESGAGAGVGQLVLRLASALR